MSEEAKFKMPDGNLPERRKVERVFFRDVAEALAALSLKGVVEVPLDQAARALAEHDSRQALVNILIKEGYSVNYDTPDKDILTAANDLRNKRSMQQRGT